MVTLRNAGAFSPVPESTAGVERSLSMPDYVVNKRSRRFSIVPSRDTANRAVAAIVPVEENVPPIVKRLFEYCVLVDYQPHAEPHEQIEKLVIPIRDGASAAMQDSPKNRNFSLILTDHTSRMYCFCRRVLPESSEVCLSLTYCLVTKYNVPKVFYKLLECIEGQHGFGCTPELLIEQLYTRKMPKAGRMLSVITRQPSQRLIKMVVRRPQDTRLENTELCDVFRCLGPNGMLQVFETLLIERTVVLHSRHVSLLTSCMHGLLLTLYPIQWQFILITVVPNDMQEMLEVEPVLPMFAGTLNPISEETQKMGHICYVQLDEGTIKQYTTEQQQVPRLPRALRKSLLQSFKDMERFKGSNEQAAVRIAEVFVSFFAKLFVDLDTDAYEKEQFLDQVKEEDKKQFLEHLLKTEMFQEFVVSWHFSKANLTASVENGGIDYSFFNSNISELRKRAGSSLVHKMQRMMKNK